MSSLRKFGIAIMGLGRIGSIHIKNLRVSNRASIKWLVEDNVAMAQKVAQSFDSPPQCVHPTEMDIMLKDESVDGVFICTPTSLHETHVKAALGEGKAVFCEKPLTDKIETTKECYELAESKGKPLFCAFHRRFDPSFNKVRDSIHSDKGGRLRLLRFSSHDLSHPPIDYIKASGGIITDSSVHDLDMALWMSGSPAKSVYVQGLNFNPDVKAAGDHDLVVIIVTHQNGAVSVIDNGRRCSYGYDQRMEAICDDDSFIVSNRPNDQVFHYNSDHACLPAVDQSFLSRYPDAYSHEIEHFLDILGGAPLRVSKNDTLSTLTLVQAAIKSAKTGTKVDL